MLFSGSAAAVALLSILPHASAQKLDQDCQYTPEWKPCTGIPDTNLLKARFDCAAMKVAKSWKDYQQRTSAETIMRLIRFRAINADGTENKDAKSIIFNPGGPGASGIEAVLTGGSYYAEISGNRYHIIGFDPRGTGLNDPYSCIDPMGGVGVDLSDDTSFAQAYDLYTAKAEKCKKDNPDLGTRVDTLQTAYDVAAITDAVNKDDKLIRYMGYSYGTLLGNVIARNFGKRVERMVLDGNIDPNSHYFDTGIDGYTDMDGAVEKFFFDCSEGTAVQCAWRDNQQTYAELVNKFDVWVGTEALAKNRGRPEDSKLELSKSSLIRSLMVDELKNPRTYSALAVVLQDWYQNPENVRQFCKDETVKTYVPRKVCLTTEKRQEANPGADDGVSPQFDPTEAEKANVVNSITAINCLDSRFRPADLSKTDYKKWAEDAAKVTKYAGDSATAGVYSCAPWKQSPTYYDTVTPGVSARNAASYYKKSQIVFTNGQGHCSSAQRSSGLETALKEYWAPTNQNLPQRLNTVKDDNNPYGDTVFALQNANPFTSEQPAAPVQPDNGNGVNGGAQSATTAAKLRLLFRDIDERMKPDSPHLARGLYARYNVRGRPQKRDENTSTPPEDVVFEICDDGNSTTTTSATSTTSTTSAGNLTTTATVDSNTTTTTGSTTSNTRTGSVSSTTTTGSHTESDDPYGPSGTYTSVDIGRPTEVAWNTWTSSSTKPKDPKSTTWGPWSSKTNIWDVWTSQKDSVPITKTVCAAKDSCKTQVVAVPTKTIYVDYVTDVCETGLTTKVITVTATCTKGCDSKPTGIPQGYTTTVIYCSACTQPSTVTVTIKISETAKSTEWSNIADPTTGKPVKPTTTGTDEWSSWVADGSATDKSVKLASTASAGQWSSWAADGSSAKVSTPAAASSTWAAWDGAATGSSKSVSGTDGWSAWATATGSSPVAKYTGAASANTVASGSLFAAVFAGLFML